MPMKLNVGLSKKVGLPDYGSLGASCHVELELDSTLLATDLDSLSPVEALMKLYELRRLAEGQETGGEGSNVKNPRSGKGGKGIRAIKTA